MGWWFEKSGLQDYGQQDYDLRGLFPLLECGGLPPLWGRGLATVQGGAVALRRGEPLR
ncbi:MAG: hypothetical protein FWG50_10455 [Kiritimatiellaeota bacterium]|nr:hypothetical protein [Kiritimatiellota bacterium]